MEYYSTGTTVLDDDQRAAAAEQDVKGLIWISRARFGK